MVRLGPGQAERSFQAPGACFPDSVGEPPVIRHPKKPHEPVKAANRRLPPGFWSSPMREKPITVRHHADRRGEHRLIPVAGGFGDSGRFIALDSDIIGTDTYTAQTARTCMYGHLEEPSANTGNIDAAPRVDSGRGQDRTLRSPAPGQYRPEQGRSASRSQERTPDRSPRRNPGPFQRRPPLSHSQTAKTRRATG